MERQGESDRSSGQMGVRVGQMDAGGRWGWSPIWYPIPDRGYPYINESPKWNSSLLDIVISIAFYFSQPKSKYTCFGIFLIKLIRLVVPV